MTSYTGNWEQNKGRVDECPPTRKSNSDLLIEITLNDSQLHAPNLLCIVNYQKNRPGCTGMSRNNFGLGGKST
jgi:hypothetical protein